ncbi:hypothetical protein JTE90_021091 [Oedothorax gibbosus]|uniref:Secreted protein n=1 Tax=Oedothorax gibbosus TaxID=931172 RepID=A0AAV6VTK4_9ARAC|nr:hypothetical protein JTE90_021091 [Oedothorax gibbosus]
MLIYLTLILLVSFGAVVSDLKKYEYCNQRRPAHCFTDKVEEENIEEIPDSVEALSRICPILIPRLKCGADYINECRMERTFHGRYIEEKLEIIHNLTVEACDTNSKLHRELTISLPCITQVLKGHLMACFPLVKEVLDEITSHISIDVIENNLVLEDDLNKFYCFRESLKFTCLVDSTSVTCGDRAKKLLEEVLDRIQFLDIKCNSDIYDEVKAAAAVIQLEMESKLVTD